MDTPAKTNIHQHCVDTGCCLDNLPRTMTSMGKLQERFKGILAVSDDDDDDDDDDDI